MIAIGKHVKECMFKFDFGIPDDIRANIAEPSNSTRHMQLRTNQAVLLLQAKHAIIVCLTLGSEDYMYISLNKENLL